MFNQGLSLDQAPPISVVLRFFLTVPFFGILVSLLMIAFPSELLTPSDPFSLASLHLLFLGVLTMSMIGALFQMQSVLGGVSIPAPSGNSFIIHALLLGGTLSLGGAFLSGFSFLFIIAAVLLGSAIVFFTQLLMPLLFGSITHDTLKGMRLALFSLFGAAILGIIMATSYANGSFGDYHAVIRTSHYSLALMGWIGALIIAVAFQIVEMFYVTEPYSGWCKRNAFRIVAAALLVKIVFLFSALSYDWIADLLLSALLAGFAVTTLRRLYDRKRRVSDVSIWFWNLGMGLLLLAISAHLLYLWIGDISLELFSLITFALFTLSIILGMMSKIVPFLIWFHLNASGYMETPIMSNIITASQNKALFALFVLTAVGSIASPWESFFLCAAGLSALMMFLLLGYNLIKAVRLYRHVQMNGTRFEMFDEMSAID